jgi:hypothetical protein
MAASKLLLLSVMIATMAIPMIAARDPDAKHGLRKTIRWFLAYVAFYVFACIVIFPRLISE